MYMTSSNMLYRWR